MMSSLQQTLGNFAQSVSNSVNTALGTNNPSPPGLSRSEVNKLEETERSRRLEQVSQTRINKENAANVSSLIRTQSFPVFRGNVSKGYKRVTIKYEEEERRRRLTNKSESALRRTNANKTARMIQKLGWPLYGGRSGAEYILMDPTKLLEEEEREWRTNDSYWTTTAKHNAATVANIIRWNSFQKNPKAGYRRHTRFLEEKERRSRLTPEAMNNGMENAYNQAKLIRQMGAPFYVQTPSSKRDFSDVHKLEEKERERRINSPSEQQLARELASVASGRSLNKETEVEEQERGRRMKDVGAQKLAKENAKHVSLMVRESSSNKINGTAPMWFSISRNSMNALEEIERTRRMRDVDGQNLARQNAKKVSDIVLHKWSLPPKRNLNTIEEEERQSRILDRAQQSIAIKNARKVSGLVAKHNLLSSSSKSFALAMEESERSRRLQDSDQQGLARDNAKRVSSLVSSLNVAPGRHVTIRDAPLSPAKLSSIPPVEALPTYHAPSASPTTVNIPTAPLQKAPVATAPLQKSASTTSAVAVPYEKGINPAALPTTLPLDAQRPSGEFKRSESPLIAAAPVVRSSSSSAIPRSAAVPISSTPIAAAPIPLSSAPLSSAPLSSAPLSSAPLSSAPLSSAPLSSAPLSSAPLSSAPLSSAPLSSAPLFSAPLFSAPLFSAPLFSAPLSSAPLSSAPLSSSGNLSSSGSLSSSPTIQPIVLPSTANPVPVAPLATATAMPAMPIRQTTYATPTVPVDSIAIAHPALGERQRKKLMKQAEKHNKKSEKDVRKAEQNMLRAEKFHQKGRDDKAVKLEHKAESLMKAAEHERRWATGLQHELAPNAPAPASM